MEERTLSVHLSTNAHTQIRGFRKFEEFTCEHIAFNTDGHWKPGFSFKLEKNTLRCLMFILKGPG